MLQIYNCYQGEVINDKNKCEPLLLRLFNKKKTLLFCLKFPFPIHCCTQTKQVLFREKVLHVFVWYS